MATFIGTNENDTYAGPNGERNVILGQRGDDDLSGGDLADRIEAGSGRDTVFAGEGDDLIFGESGDDALHGGDGDDTMVGGAGDDAFVGGAGIDEVSYSSARYSVSVDLHRLSGIGTGRGEAQGDTFQGIENIVGSRYGDSLDGDDGRNSIRGGAGDDRMDGGDGIDTVDYSTSTAGVEIGLNLNSGFGPHSGRGGDAEGDRISNFECIVGSKFDDDLTGDSYSNILRGGGGDDYLDGRFGTDTLIGGAGDDFLHGDDGKDRLYGGSGRDDLFGGPGADVFVFNLLSDSTVAASARDTVIWPGEFGGDDRISLKAIDADQTQAGNQTFSFIGDELFHGVAGELRYEVVTDTSATVFADVDGDRRSDMAIDLDFRFPGFSVAAMDFIL